MHPSSPSPPTVAGYASGPVTKAPNWHGLVVLDVLLNNLTSGLFLVAALAELVRPAAFAAVAKVAYPVALVLLLADLACLVADLGDPLRFHHMLRVFKPSSPMSLGTWCLTVYSVPLSVLAVLSLLPDGPAVLGWARSLCAIAGILPALGVAVYKGVLFSTSAQPGWKDARWLGCYLTNSALLLGCAELLALANLMGQPRAVDVLKPALLLLLLLNAVALGWLVRDLRPALSKAYTDLALFRLGALVVAGGMLGAVGLLLLGGISATLIAALLIIAGALVIRFELVRLPHRQEGGHP
jgi:Polysulphide reductase, NrfD